MNSSNYYFKLKDNIGAVAAVAASALLLAPDVKWVLGAETNWAWDMACYGSKAVNLFRASEGGIADWAEAMEHATVARPPLLVWAGQLAVPLRHIFGEVSSALLLLNLLWDGTAFWLVYVISRRLAAGSIEAVTAVVACAASGIVIALNHQFLVETPQCAAAAFMMFAAFQIEKRSWLRALSIIVLATVISMLSKASSITFVVPFLCYAFLAMWVTRSRPKPAMRAEDLLLAAAGGAAALACFAWYRENLSYVTHHFREATTDEFALNWGREVHLGPKLSYWTSTLATALSPFVEVPIAAGIIAIWAIAVSAVRLRSIKFYALLEAAVDNGLLFVLTLFCTICVTLLAFSLQINEDARFLISLIPMIAVLLGWALSLLQIRALSVAMLLVFAAGGIINHAISFGYNPIGVSRYNWLGPSYNRPAERQLITAAVRATCNDGHDWRPIVVAVIYSWLSACSAPFADAKEALLRSSRPCKYTSYGMRETDVSHAIDTILSIKARYIITVSPEKQRQMEAAGEPEFANRISRPVAEALARDPRFVRLPESNDTVLIYQPAAEASASK